jgi:hypothetical protein
MDIIHQTMEIITQGYYESLKKLMDGEASASDLVIDLEAMLRKVGAKLAGEALEQLDEAIRIGRERKKEWHIERRGDEKNIATALGEVSYRRTYYRHKQRREYAYLSDEWAGIENHARMDDSLRVKLSANAVDGSYQKAVERESHSGIVSKSAVMNAIRKIGKLSNEAAKIQGKKKPIDIVYVEADEDHVALQQGGTALAKIIYVHEGKEWVSKGRYRLKGVRYFTGADQSSEDLWLEVATYLDAAYESIGKVFISGDGHRWIKEGLNWIEKSVFVLDRFHLAKYVRQATGHMEHAREPLWGYLERGMSRAVSDLMDVLEEYAQSPAKKQEVRDAKRYIENHWAAIQRQKSQGYVGCSAEGHVSHVLSARFSSRPMGWSLLGLDLLARMRVFQFNEGNLYDFVRYQKMNEAKEQRIRKLDQRVWNRSRKTSHEVLRNLTAVNYGKNNGTRVLLKACRGF